MYSPEALPLEIPRRAREEAQAVGHRSGLGPGDLDRLADVQRLELGQLLGVLVDRVGHREEDRRPLAGCLLEPLGQRGTGCLDDPLDVLLRSARDLGDRLAGGRVQNLHRSALDRVDPLAADVVLRLVHGDAHFKPPSPASMASGWSYEGIAAGVLVAAWCLCGCSTGKRTLSSADLDSDELGKPGDSASDQRLAQPVLVALLAGQYGGANDAASQPAKRLGR